MGEGGRACALFRSELILLLLAIIGWDYGINQSRRQAIEEKVQYTYYTVQYMQ